MYFRYTCVNAYAAFNTGDFLFSNVGYVWFLIVGYMPACNLFTFFGSFSVVTASAYLTVWVSQCLRIRTRSDNKVRELIAVKVLHTSLLNTTVVAFKVLPLGSYALMPAPSPPFKTILEIILWSCRCNTPDVINVIKMPSFQCFLYLRKQKKVTGG